MEDKSITCSKKLHEKIDAIIYCQECDIYMCNKCKQSHSDLFESYHLHNLDKNKNDIFTGLCKDANIMLSLNISAKLIIFCVVLNV